MTITVDTLQKISEDTQFTKHSLNYKQLFSKFENEGEGDCLFRSISQILYQNENKHLEIRKKICQFYQKFDKTGSYPEYSLKSKLQLALIGSEFDSNDVRTDESTGESLSEENVWGSTAEILIAAMIFRTNIIIISTFNKSSYNVIPYCGSSKAKKPPIFLFYNGENHYEALVPIRRSSRRLSKQAEEPKPSKETETTRKNKTSRKNKNKNKNKNRK